MQGTTPCLPSCRAPAPTLLMQARAARDCSVPTRIGTVNRGASYTLALGTSLARAGLQLILGSRGDSPARVFRAGDQRDAGSTGHAPAPSQQLWLVGLDPRPLPLGPGLDSHFPTSLGGIYVCVYIYKPLQLPQAWICRLAVTTCPRRAVLNAVQMALRAGASGHFASCGAGTGAQE